MTGNKHKCPYHQTGHIKGFDALDPATRSDPMPFYDWLREDEVRRIYKLPQEENFYLIHRYEDVKMVLTDTERFSSHVIPSQVSPFFALMDAPGHQRIREVMAELFTTEHLRIFENSIQQVIHDATVQLTDGRKHELFETWADAIPLGTLAALFGLNGSYQAIRKMHNEAIAINRALFVKGGTGPRRSSNPDFTEKATISLSLLKNLPRILKLKNYIGSNGMRELARMMKPSKDITPGPRPDFASIPGAVAPMLNLMNMFAEGLSEKTNGTGPSAGILKEHIRKGGVTKTEMIMAGAFILFAGYETTASLLSNCFVHLARNPGTLQALKSDPSMLEPFIEESLRFYTPVGRFLRKTKMDSTIGVQSIPAGAILIVMPGAANTDPEKFANGCAFDPGRENNRQHLSFGKGAHFCIGAPLARMQVTIALKELISRSTKIELNESQPLRMVTDRDNGILRYEKIYVWITG